MRTYIGPRKLREKLGMDRTAFGKGVDPKYDRNTVHYWEHKRTPLNYTLLQKIANAYDATMDDFYEEG